MRKLRRGRLLSADERRLWAQVARGITPLGGRTLAPEPEPPPAPPPAPLAEAGLPAGREPRPSTAAAAALAPLERRTLRALRRGARAADAAIDLHGLTQEAAHGRLLAFLRRAQAQGASLVLVVTGKGGPGAPGAFFEERGVLRRMVPHWLRLPDVRPLVLGFEEASPRHGGSGALYVRLRRRRGGGGG